MKPVTVEITLGDHRLKLETGYLAKQAAGSVVAYLDETVAFSSVCTADPRPGIDFFPLSVDYREKTQAAGKFPGGFIKREGRPTNKEILTCRLIDRPVRPMFPEPYKDEVQVCAFVVQVDRINDPDIAAMNASFAALHIADMPFAGPLGAVRVARVNGKLVVNPTFEERKKSELEIVVAGSRDAITMVEGTCAEISEDLFLEVLDFAHGHVKAICAGMDDLLKATGRTRTPWAAPASKRHAIYDHIVSSGEYDARIEKALLTVGKHERSAAVKALRDEILATLIPADDAEADDKTKTAKTAWHDLEAKVVRAMLMRNLRVDGRKCDEIRDIHITAGWQRRLHGSAVFTRGETQALVVCTLGTLKDQQIVDGLDEEYSKKFDFQYNFPPYSVGEVKPIRGVSRREIGHGNLAERALMPILPEPTDFPYTIRLISDILESNGSSSMASVCGGTLAMMDAGVPIKQPVAGIAMGLLKEDANVVILSDILGSEDHHGDMDFKVAGTGRGITAVQMDIKVQGISKEIMARALAQAKEGRLHILKKMMAALPRPAAAISEYAPRLLMMMVPVEKIGLIIGPGGKNIKRIQEETGANIEIEDDGSVHISSLQGGGAEDAKRQIELIIAEVEVGQIYNGRVVSIKDFGAFVEILPGQEGLCHVSELSDEYVSKVADVVKLGEYIDVKVIARDEQDRIKLSRKAVLMERKKN
ncbi:MAG: polyribonucleotide nucleotidyltransferase [Planctomycetes bacterium]|nr:polyribonucleotide nucleotidyltransferase [Planctomycetota bacterium]